MNTKENCLRELGNLVNMAIDNTKGSKAVEICYREILAYIDGLETENDKLWQRHNEEHNQICKAIEYVKTNEFYLDYKTGACVKGVMPLLEILEGSDE